MHATWKKCSTKLLSCRTSIDFREKSRTQVEENAVQVHGKTNRFSQSLKYVKHSDGRVLPGKTSEIIVSKCATILQVLFFTIKYYYDGNDSGSYLFGDRGRLPQERFTVFLLLIFIQGRKKTTQE